MANIFEKIKGLKKSEIKNTKLKEKVSETIDVYADKDPSDFSDLAKKNMQKIYDLVKAKYPKAIPSIKKPRKTVKTKKATPKSKAKKPVSKPKKTKAVPKKKAAVPVGSEKIAKDLLEIDNKIWKELGISLSSQITKEKAGKYISKVDEYAKKYKGKLDTKVFNYLDDKGASAMAEVLFTAGYFKSLSSSAKKQIKDNQIFETIYYPMHVLKPTLRMPKKSDAKLSGLGKLVAIYPKKDGKSHFEIYERKKGLYDSYEVKNGKIIKANLHVSPDLIEEILEAKGVSSNVDISASPIDKGDEKLVSIEIVYLDPGGWTGRLDDGSEDGAGEVIGGSDKKELKTFLRSFMNTSLITDAQIKSLLKDLGESAEISITVSKDMANKAFAGKKKDKQPTIEYKDEYTQKSDFATDVVNKISELTGATYNDANGMVEAYDKKNGTDVIAEVYKENKPASKADVLSLAKTIVKSQTSKKDSPKKESKIDTLAECKALLAEARKKAKKSGKAKAPKKRRDSTILKDKVGKVFVTIDKDVKDKKLNKELNEIKTIFANFMVSIDKLAQDGDIEKLTKIKNAIKEIL